MGKKVSKGRTSAAVSCNSRRSTAGAVRVVYISNPTVMVKTSASEFRAVVQSLTGRNISSTSSRQNEEINLYSDNQFSAQFKAPKLLEEEFQFLKDMDSSESAIFDDSVTLSDCCNDREHGDVRIFGELEVLPIQNPDFILPDEVFETVESIGDTSHIFFDIFSPSILFSEFEYL